MYSVIHVHIHINIHMHHIPIDSYTKMFIAANNKKDHEFQREQGRVCGRVWTGKGKGKMT